VERTREFWAQHAAAHQRCQVDCGLREQTAHATRALLGLLIPELGPAARDVEGVLERAQALSEEWQELLTRAGVNQAATIREAWWGELPTLASDLEADAQALYDHDPAASSVDEVKVAYPGFFALGVYRLAHALHRHGVPLLPRLMTEYAHRETGIDIHPGAQLASPVVIDHGTGLVIGETTEVGRNVILYQGVTLGALSVTKRQAGRKRHPTLEDDVIVYAGATILGGETRVGRGSIVGGGVFLTESIPPDSQVLNRPEIQIRPRKRLAAPSGEETL
jgi:serine O-acetyltransferase